jgi:hypothetical protein
MWWWNLSRFRASIVSTQRWALSSQLPCQRLFSLLCLSSCAPTDLWLQLLCRRWYYVSIPTLPRKAFLLSWSRSSLSLEGTDKYISMHARLYVDVLAHSVLVEAHCFYGIKILTLKPNHNWATCINKSGKPKANDLVHLAGHRPDAAR